MHYISASSLPAILLALSSTLWAAPDVQVWHADRVNKQGRMIQPPPETDTSRHPIGRDGMIVIDLADTIREFTSSPVGINLNYLIDKNSNRTWAQPIEKPLEDLKVKFLRYPGGEKSDFYLWSAAPFDKPSPRTFGWYRSQVRDPLDFDEYMAIARKLGAEPYIVVGYDSASRSGISREQYLQNAIEWVRYANIKKGYGVKYWEIGNENWNNNTISPEGMADVVAEFAKAMKAVDPSIKLGSNGRGGDWWPRFLPKAAPYLDFVVISNYPSVSSYDAFKNNDGIGLSYASSTVKDIEQFAPPADKARLRVVAAEFNAIDWNKHWSDANDMGHALLNFAILGDLLMEPRVDMTMFWTTRWMDTKEDTAKVTNLLDQSNQLTAQGLALRIWGNFLDERLVRVSSLHTVVSYASYSPQKQRVSVFLVNKDGVKHPVTLQLKGAPWEVKLSNAWVLQGAAPTDRWPKWTARGAMEIFDDGPTLELAPYSITVVQLSGNTP